MNRDVSCNQSACNSAQSSSFLCTPQTFRPRKIQKNMCVFDILFGIGFAGKHNIDKFVQGQQLKKPSMKQLHNKCLEVQPSSKLHLSTACSGSFGKYTTSTCLWWNCESSSPLKYPAVGFQNVLDEDRNSLSTTVLASTRHCTRLE